MKSIVSVAFVDDHPIFLSGLHSFFASQPDYEIVSSGQCAADAVAIAEEHRPDLLLMDLRMPGDPFAAIKGIAALSPSTKVVAFTALADVNCATRALEAGASGYILKGTNADELARALRVVQGGEHYITPAFAAKVISALRDPKRNADRNGVKFNVREAQILTLLLNGSTNKEIGERLRISEKTVRHYMTLLMRKLNARNRLEVVLMARRNEMPLSEDLVMN